VDQLAHRSGSSSLGAIFRRVLSETDSVPLRVPPQGNFRDFLCSRVGGGWERNGDCKR